MDRKFLGDFICLAMGISLAFAFSALVSYSAQTELIANIHGFRVFGIPPVQLVACGASAFLAGAGLLWFMSSRRAIRSALFVVGALIAWFALGLYFGISLELLARVWAYWVSVAVAVCIALVAARPGSGSRHIAA
jgi:hypothetical protein